MTAVPGFIDSHEHIMGGGGEGGFHTRTPEASLGDLIRNGITTVVGCIGTDGVGRDMTALLAKAHALENEGIAADARVAGMLSGKAGIVNVHPGDSERRLDLIRWEIHETEIPASQFLPTHVNRNEALFEECLDFAAEGGTIDFTGNEDIDYWETICDEVRVQRNTAPPGERDLKRLVHHLF